MSSTSSLTGPGVNGTTPSSRLIDRIRTRFHATRGYIEIPEWGEEDGTPLEVFFTPMTPADYEALDARQGKTNAENNVNLVIMKARDEHQQPLFAWGDKATLMQESAYPVLIRLVNAIMALNGPPTVEDAAKNSATGQTSASN